jgi:hypothetical protein
MPMAAFHIAISGLFDRQLEIGNWQVKIALICAAPVPSLTIELTPSYI